MISYYLRLVFLSPFSLFFLPTDSFMILSESKHLLVTFIWQPEKSEDVKKLLLIYLSSVSSFCCPLLYATLNYFLCFACLLCFTFTFLHFSLLHLPEVSISTNDLTNRVGFKIWTLNAWKIRIDQAICEEMCASNSMVAFWGTHISRSLVIYVFQIRIS